MSTAVIFLTCNCLRKPMLVRAPNCPPSKTAINSPIKKGSSFPNWTPFDHSPSKPAIEFNRINALAQAAIRFELSHFIKCKIGERKIPPPIPTNPDKNPMPPPKALLPKVLDSFNSELRTSLFFSQSKIAARSNENPKMTKNVSSATRIRAPRKARGTLRRTSGKILFQLIKPARWKSHTLPITTIQLQANAARRIKS